MSANPQARKWRKAAEKRRRRKLTVRVAIAAVLGYGIGAIAAERFHHFGQQMQQPPTGECLLTWSITGHHELAFCDESGDFRSCEDGHRLGQVYRWERP